MIYPDSKPTSHVSPYKRIELGARPKQPEPKWVPIDPVTIPVIWPVPPIEDIYCGMIDYATATGSMAKGIIAQGGTVFVELRLVEIDQSADYKITVNNVVNYRAGNGG